MLSGEENDVKLTTSFAGRAISEESLRAETVMVSDSTSLAALREKLRQHVTVLSIIFSRRLRILPNSLTTITNDLF